MSKENSAFKLEIYIDRASSPTFFQAKSIVDSDSDAKKLIFWKRHIITDSDVLDRINAESFLSLDELNKHAKQLLKQYDNTKVAIFGNIFWCKDTVRLIKNISNIKGVEITKLNLFDDGFAEYSKITNFGAKSINQQVNDLKQGRLRIGKILSKSKLGFFGLFFSSKLKRKVGTMYSWHYFYPTTYFFIKKDYLDRSEFSYLKSYLSGHIEQACLNNDLLKVSEGDKKDNTLSIDRLLGINTNHVKVNKDGFLFVG